MRQGATLLAVILLNPYIYVSVYSDAIPNSEVIFET